MDGQQLGQDQRRRRTQLPRARPPRERLHDGRQRGAAPDSPERRRSARVGFLGARHRVEHRQRGRRRDRARHGRPRARSARPAAALAPPRGSGVQARLPRRRLRAEERACATRRATAATGSRSSSAPTSPSTSAAAPASRRRARAPSRCWSSAKRGCSASTSRTPAARPTTAGPTSASRSRATSPRATRRARGASPTFRCSAASTRPFRTSTRPCTRSRTCCAASASRRARTTTTCAALFFHRPYHLMPVQAMSFLYVRGLARGDHRRAELEALCAEAGVSVDDVLRETVSTPDLYANVLEGGAASRSLRGDQRGGRSPAQASGLSRALAGEDEPRLGSREGPRQPLQRRAAGLDRGGLRGGGGQRHRAHRRAARRGRLRQRRRRRGDADRRPARAGRRRRAHRLRAALEQRRRSHRASNTRRCTTAWTCPGSPTRPRTSFASRASARATTRASRISASSTTSTSPDVALLLGMAVRSVLGGTSPAGGCCSGRRSEPVRARSERRSSA